ncbi:cystathionine gamma-synthase [Melioribacteraceae bacterium 4301-Me]|uniref:cystathionine gamma-synthase n=1 Tax=Pyranulibacter aquaticus TaxID=3163344 RepID=UPI0035965DF4
MGFSTDAIHAGQTPDLTTGAVITPIYQTSTYAQEELGVNKGYEYGRTHNFTRQALEKNIATLEKGNFGIAFSSGLAAIQSVLFLLKPGSHVIVTENIYGGTFRLMDSIFKDYGIEFTWVDTSDIRKVKKAVKLNTKMVYIETPTNPLLRLTDLRGVAYICKKHKLISVVDNTFMTPYFQQPLKFGIDVVLHSTTKYLNGHSDVIGGIVITNNSEIHERLRYLQNAVGAVPSPFDCWLTLRATKTLSVRMKQHNENAIKIAKYLSKNPKVKKVFYPGLPNHPHYKLAKRQMSGFGGMLTADFGSINLVKKILKSVKIFTLAESLGGVESLISHPASMTHASVPKNLREKMGITDGLIRFSVGIEDVEDLIADITQAIGK